MISLGSDKRTEDVKHVIFFIKQLVAPCASSPRASEGHQTACLRNRIDCTCRVVLRCECACVLSDYWTGCKNSCTGHTRKVLLLNGSEYGF